MQSNFINRLPIRGSDEFIDVVVREGSVADAANWDQLVQPHHNDPKSPDAKWKWEVLLNRYRKSERFLGRKATLFCIDVPNENDDAVPLARMIISEGYPALHGGGKGSVYVWYLAAAPTSTLEALGVACRPLMALEALIDTAIQHSQSLGYDGRIGLHAHPAGGSGLFCKYRDRVRMQALGSNASLTWARRLVGGNDGRYFWSDAQLSRGLARSLDYLR